MAAVIVLMASVIVSAGMSLFVLALSLFGFFPLPAFVVDDVACILVAVDVVMSIAVLMLTCSCPTGLGPTADRAASGVSPSS